MADGSLRFLRRASGLGLVLILAAGLAQAQAVGEALVDGRRVTLFADGTWTWASTSGCAAIAPKVEFCSTDPAWRPSPPPNSVVTAAFWHDDRNYGQFIAEGLGLADGLTMEGFRDLVLQGTEATTGSKPVVMSLEDSTVSNLPAETMTYAINIHGMSAVFANTMVLTDHLTLQVQTYMIGRPEDFGDAARKLHTDFVAATRIKTE